MNAKRSSRSTKQASPSPLMVRLDSESKAVLSEAATLRGISVSAYVRIVMVPQAQREVRAAKEHVILLSPEEQLAFWNALQETPVLTDAQRELGAIMRGEK